MKAPKELWRLLRGVESVSVPETHGYTRRDVIEVGPGAVMVVSCVERGQAWGRIRYRRGR